MFPSYYFTISIVFAVILYKGFIMIFADFSTKWNYVRHMNNAKLKFFFIYGDGKYYIKPSETKF